MSQPQGGKGKSFGSNWKNLKTKIVTNDKPRDPKRNLSKVTTNNSSAPAPIERKSSELVQLERIMRKKVVALDCEMVGIGPTGKLSALARCSMVDFDGNVLYDEFVKPKGFVTDFRTKYSGIRKSDLRQDKAVSLEEVIILF